jgi:vacuolar-type H+-ATPase subunit I/STV1
VIFSSFLLTQIIHQSFERRYEQLEYVAYYVELWIARVRMLKGIFTVLNMLNFDVSRHILIAECWVPTKNLQQVSYALDQGTVS